MSKPSITRFAPSPTGYLHIGGLRTALFSFLMARHTKGTFRLRIEDTDQKRSVEDADKKLIAILSEFGLNPDGSIVYQSKRMRQGIYKEAAETLVKKRLAYYCFCSPEQLEQMRKQKTARQEPPGYDGTCRSIPFDEAQARASQEPAVIRMKWNHTEHEIEFNDELHGNVRFQTKNLEDAILLKTDGFPTYHLASVVDDHEMNITDIIRGEEWLPSAPLHALLYRSLGYHVPRFWHLPLILNPDKTKLSKRQGDVAVESYLEKGYLKEAILNYIAFLGWNPGTERELFTLDELIAEFDATKLNTSSAIFDLQKLNWYNSEYIKHDLAVKKDSYIYDIIKAYLTGYSKEQALKIFGLFFERIHTLSELSDMSSFLRRLPEYDPSLLIFKRSDREKTRAGIKAAITTVNEFSEEWTAINLELALKKQMEADTLSFGDVFWPARVALSGMKASPPPTEIMEFLGKKETLTRLKKASSTI